MIRVLQGDCRAMLRTLPAGSVHCVVTSPPYYGLRDYQVAGQMGLEATPDEYIARMVEVFREVRRVLRDDGTCWVNMGDSYNNFRSQMGPGQAVHGRDDLRSKPAPDSRKRGWGGAKEKDLLMMPARLALALQSDGWWLRSEIVWAKPNPMPESCQDRPTSAHEKVYLLAKSARYFYDADAVREKVGEETRRNTEFRGESTPYKNNRSFDNSAAIKNYAPAGEPSLAGRNLRNVWIIATEAFPEAHFATFPTELAERCIKAGTSERGCCAQCGAPWVRQTERSTSFEGGSGRAGRTAGDINTTGKWAGIQYGTNIKLGPVVTSTTTGWAPFCKCAADVVPATVLDPFAGAGTTGLVADRLQRNAILIELNPAYCTMMRNRITRDAGLFADVAD